jgi:hypothetical protein
MIDEAGAGAPQLRRSLTLWNLVIIGIVLIQPIAPMGIYGVVNNAARGHVVTTILIAMVAMLLTAISYGMLARIYPSAGSAYTYVGQELHTSLGFLTGWAMLMDYILNPLICIILCSKLTQNILPEVPYWMLAIFAATAFTLLNLRGVEDLGADNEVMAGAMTIVVIVFFAYVIRFLISCTASDRISSASLFMIRDLPLRFDHPRHFYRGVDVHRVRCAVDVFGRSGESAAQHSAGHCTGMRADRHFGGAGSLRCPTGVGRQTISGRSSGIRVSSGGAPSRWSVSVPTAELHHPSGEYRFGNGRTACSIATALRHGTK